MTTVEPSRSGPAMANCWPSWMFESGTWAPGPAAGLEPAVEAVSAGVGEGPRFRPIDEASCPASSSRVMRPSALLSYRAALPGILAHSPGWRVPSLLASYLPINSTA